MFFVYPSVNISARFCCVDIYAKETDKQGGAEQKRNKFFHLKHLLILKGCRADNPFDFS